MSTDGDAVWTVLADPSRRQMFRHLAVRPRSVTELADALPISRPAVSQHLKLLREVELVRVYTRGTRHIYEVDPEGLHALRQELDDFWGQTLDNLKSVAERTDVGDERDKEEGP